MMDDKSSPVRSNFIKGDLAESIVARLFESLGFHLTYNGMEVTNPELLLLQKKRLIQQADIAKYRAKADLIVVREQTAHMPALRLDLEIKFSVTGEIPVDRIKSCDADAHFIFVDTENFWSVNHETLRQQNKLNRMIVFRTLNKLEDDPLFTFSAGEKQLIRNYKPFLATFGLLPKSSPAKRTLPENKSQPLKTFPKNQGALWQPDANAKLLEEYATLRILKDVDETIGLLAKQFDRSVKSIRIQLRKLGILTD